VIRETYRHVVVVKANSEDASDGLVDDTESVTLAGLNINDGEGDLWAAVEATDTVDG